MLVPGMFVLMKRKTVLSLSPEQTRSIGERCSFYLQAGDCIPLIGELGSGKLAARRARCCERSWRSTPHCQQPLVYTCQSL